MSVVAHKVDEGFALLHFDVDSVDETVNEAFVRETEVIGGVVHKVIEALKQAVIVGMMASSA
ncbi:hypothetical protein BCON_0317g00030 [Botryotinia convoluta]|uniref:Uncharacterized protein n=1 Tax=Botryotinia convoluta TaxID=54673 RepID=A0A4Z1HNR6_9HELO|nr:hypothetical protein BCON_0317g00030 [Botryotinia convoluta]